MRCISSRRIVEAEKKRHDLQVEQNPDTIDKVLQVAKQVRQLIKVENKLPTKVHKRYPGELPACS